MKNPIPTGVATLIIAIMALIIGMLYWKFASPGAHSVEIERTIQATAIKPPAGWKPGQVVRLSIPTGSVPTKAPSTNPAHKK